MSQMEVAASTGKDRGEDDAVQVINIKGRDILFRSPGSGAIAMLGARMSARNTLSQAGGLITSIFSWLADPDDIDLERISDEDFEEMYGGAVEFTAEDNREYLENLLDRSEIEIKELVSVMDTLMERWSARPTERSSASAHSRRQSGRPSTGASRRAR